MYWRGCTLVCGVGRKVVIDGQKTGKKTPQEVRVKAGEEGTHITGNPKQQGSKRTLTDDK